MAVGRYIAFNLATGRSLVTGCSPVAALERLQHEWMVPPGWAEVIDCGDQAGVVWALRKPLEVARARAGCRVVHRGNAAPWWICALPAVRLQENDEDGATDREGAVSAAPASGEDREADTRDEGSAGAG